jgi:hypothetical protein
MQLFEGLDPERFPVKWEDHPSNPLIGPRWWTWLVGDPVVLAPRETPDRSWSLFANSLWGIYRYVSRDGVRWKCRGCVIRNAIRPWLLKVENTYILYYQTFRNVCRRSRIACKISGDLRRWYRLRNILRTTLAWEGAHLSNPCVLPRDNTYWLYYSANGVFLEDMGFCEPKYISVAFSDSPFGPFRKWGKPLLGTDPNHPWRNRGAGAIKVYPNLLPGRLTGFNNGIFRTAGGKSASAILLLRSRDGLTWEEYPKNPIIAPTDPMPGWKQAHVYQMDVKRVGDELWMWYNGRDGWRIGQERIGLSILPKADRLWEEQTRPLLLRRGHSY